MKPIHVLSRAVIMHENRILLCKTKKYEQNFYFLPGGHVESNESAEQAVLRELQEELGGSWKVERFLGCLEYSFVPDNPDKCHTHEFNFCFLVLHDTAQMYQHSQEDHISFEWIALNDFSVIDLRPYPLKQLLSQWLNQSHGGALVSCMEG